MYEPFIIVFIFLGCSEKEPAKECKLPVLEVKSNSSNPQTDFDLSLTNTDDATLVAYSVKDDKGNTVKEQTSSSKPNFLTTVSVPFSGNYSFSAKVTTDCGIKDVVSKTLGSQICNTPAKITLKENPAQVIVASWANGTVGDIQGVVTWTILPADGSKTSDNNGSTFSSLKAGVAYTITAKFKDKCNVDKTIVEQLSTINEYASYDFYVAENGCYPANSFTKNFQKVNGLDGYSAFNVVGNNIYTFGAKKYRNNPTNGYYAKSDDYGGVVYKNGVELYSDIGGYASNVFSVRENAGNVYCLTGYKSQEGGVSAELYTTFRTVPKIYKNGILLDSLQGPFNNTAIVNNTSITNKGFAIQVTDMVFRGSDIYVVGICRDLKNGNLSIGYWKNGVYTQLKIVSDGVYYTTQMLLADTGDIYYYSFISPNKSVNSLFKNNTEILKGALDNFSLKDFGVLNGDLYILNKYYDNGNRLGVYKNGILENSTSIGTKSSDTFKLYVEDGKIFICAGNFDYENKMKVYEYKPSTKTLVSINGTGSDYASCGFITIAGFQVKKR
jgi:hypothetical protein